MTSSNVKKEKEKQMEVGDELELLIKTQMTEESSPYLLTMMEKKLFQSNLQMLIKLSVHWPDLSTEPPPW